MNFSLALSSCAKCVRMLMAVVGFIERSLLAFELTTNVVKLETINSCFHSQFQHPILKIQYIQD